MTKNKLSYFDVVGVGRAYTDIIAKVSPTFLKKHAIPNDAGKRFSPSELIAIKKELFGAELLQGGVVANTMCGVSALGGHAGFFGKVANDVAGKASIQSFAARDIPLLCDPADPKAEMSATCLVLTTNDGSRSFAYDCGCADNFTDKDFSRFDFNNASFFLVEGHLLATSPAAQFMQKIVSQVKKTACRVAITLSDVSEWPFDVHSLNEQVDIVIGNAKEIECFRKAASQSTTPQGQIEVVTAGANGAYAKQEDLKVSVEAVAPRVWVNSVGAGDQFAAGLLMGLARRYDLKKSMLLGASCASAVLEEIGARPSVGRSLKHLMEAKF